MNVDSPPLVAPTEELAPEAMINEGGAIAQPALPPKLAACVEKTHHLERVFVAFGAGLLLGLLLTRD